MGPESKTVQRAYGLMTVIGKNVRLLIAERIRTAVRIEATAIFAVAVWKGEPVPSAAGCMNAETNGCGSVNGAANRFSITDINRPADVKTGKQDDPAGRIYPALLYF